MGTQSEFSVRKYKHREVAESAAESLRSAGVDCWLQDSEVDEKAVHNATVNEPFVVVVFEKDAARATDAIDTFERQLVQRVALPGLTCPHCGSRMVNRHTMSLRQLVWWRVFCWNPRLPLFERRFKCADCGKFW